MLREDSVLADALTYTEEKFKPKFIVDLATSLEQFNLGRICWIVFK